MTAQWSEKFKGVIVAMNSCYDAEGRVSPAAVKKLTRFLIDKGVNGLYVGGSTGEGLLQSVEERKLVLEAAIEASAGEVPIIAHVGALSTQDGIELAVHAEKAGAAALSAVAPFYYGYSEEAVGRHWSAIADSADLPFIIYHIPATTGFSLTKGLLKQLLANPKFIGIKTTTASTYELQQFKAMGGESFLMFNGPDEQYLAGRIMGADAGIGGTYGAMPELFVQLEKQYSAGRIEAARQVQFRINDIITDMLAVPIYAALKELVRRRGVDCGDVRAPLPKLSAAHAEQIDALHAKIELAVRELAAVR
ncbi:dihydrodipicolinate synthase family protein [Cohnella fermenti]|uniref:N-acetylneuraminate lyase n=1 Tax=Cohnella fermenti TaxID=2565925 RepID=A0A4S4BW88_9BACL|nr:dihydrodipicolinate synthase family protein [Cohnella fermenti]THF77318.1 N-acetylneuraminate lyase [Cohnella fermenti]